ncbi:uncharacterized protein ARMOST_02194 [Armillaria ostoyae]|uniref:Uncharacterized protein n=1 Tax=Armillaria ostoyae TaxID=47428 RepID=A0A284QR31_ARMOS|nr:uncharacterized protein ARMOST_02194 [Armillaria ostoyae]
MYPFRRAETLSMDLRSNCISCNQFRPMAFVKRVTCTGQDMKTVIEETLKRMLTYPPFYKRHEAALRIKYLLWRTSLDPEHVNPRDTSIRMSNISTIFRAPQPHQMTLPNAVEAHIPNVQSVSSTLIDTQYRHSCVALLTRHPTILVSDFVHGTAVIRCTSIKEGIKYPVDFEPTSFLRDWETASALSRCKTLWLPSVDDFSEDIEERSKSCWYALSSVRPLEGASSTSKKFSITSNLPEETAAIEAK